ncbi:MAG: hypothetical protein GY913_10335, partial [Proteobacteria bacterium]|nr:hypothetical protein [Pseudomonadota bacterium]
GVRLYLASNGQLQPNPVALASGDAHDIAWGDWDNDGDLDLAVALELADEVLVNDGNGGFSVGWTSPEVEPTRAVAWADFDADGDLDLASGTADGTVRVLEFDGCELVPAAETTVGGAVGDVAWGEREAGAGVLLAVAALGAGATIFEVDLTSPTPLSAAYTAPTPLDATGVAWADLNQDGYGDLAVVGSGLDSVYDVENSMAMIGQASAAADSTHAVWTDWTHDGVPDLVVAHSGAEQARIYQGKEGSITELAVVANTVDAAGVAAGDRDGDGDVDLAFAKLGDQDTVHDGRWFESLLADDPTRPANVVVGDAAHRSPSPFATMLSLEAVDQPVTFDLVDRESDPADVQLEFRAVGGPWLSGSVNGSTEGLESSEAGTSQTLLWTDPATLGPGRYDVRVIVLAQRPRRIGATLARGRTWASSGPIAIALALDLPPDLDGDGWAGCDCDDTEPTTYPGAPEWCDIHDQDCDG